MQPGTEALRERATRLRQIAATLSDQRTRSDWLSMAAQMEKVAQTLEARGDRRRRWRLFRLH